VNGKRHETSRNGAEAGCWHGAGAGLKAAVELYMSSAISLLSRRSVFAAAVLALTSGVALAQEANTHARPLTGNLTDPTNWRITPGQLFNGVAALDASAQLTYTAASDGGVYGCSGSLLAGGAYILTAGHCADDFAGDMKIEFQIDNGKAAITRTATVADVTLHPLWKGEQSLDAGSDLSLIKLSAPVATINGYHLSTTNDIGKQVLIGGFGTTISGSSRSAPNWDDGNWGHFAFNTIDVDSKTFNRVMNSYVAGFGPDASFYTGTTYMFDFDDPSAGNAVSRNTLQRIASATGNAWTSGGAVDGEGLIAGGDSGGGDFVWNGFEWLLTSVHSWGWEGNTRANDGFCDALNLTGCSPRTSNDSGFGDVSGSTAVFDQLAWIKSLVGDRVVAVPEPSSWALFGLGLTGIGGMVASRRRQRHA